MTPELLHAVAPPVPHSGSLLQSDALQEDLLPLVAYSFKTHAFESTGYYRFVFLDEFQDATTNQFALLDTAPTGCYACVTAVGDNKQRIMLWAGAQRNVFEVFTETFQATR